MNSNIFIKNVKFNVKNLLNLSFFALILLFSVNVNAQEAQKPLLLYLLK